MKVNSTALCGTVESFRNYNLQYRHESQKPYYWEVGLDGDNLFHVVYGARNLHSEAYTSDPKVYKKYFEWKASCFYW